MWSLSRDSLDSLWPISWRIYITVILTAGWEPYFYPKLDFMLFWTGIFIHSDAGMEPTLAGTLFLYAAFWIAYMTAFLSLYTIIRVVRER